MLRTLILDDDALFGRVLVRHLQRNTIVPCEAIAVTGAEEALALVQQAPEPFDVLLIDQRLGAEADGIEVLSQIKRLSPQSDAIIFTTVGDTESGLRAQRAGAYRYLHKPFTSDELVLILHALQEWRETLRERDWLRVLNDVTQAAQQLLSVTAMSRVIVESGQRLGFQRVRLWAFDAATQSLVGVDQAGNTGLDGFCGFRTPIGDSIYIRQTVQARVPQYFHGLDQGQSALLQHFHGQGYRPPQGEWVVLPLMAGEHYLGHLSLDNHSRAIEITQEQRLGLTLFARQAAAALERAQLYDQEQRKSREVALLAQIGQRISNRAALTDLDTLLGDLRALLGQLLDVHNFFVALVNEPFKRLELRIEVHEHVVRAPSSLPRNQGLVNYVIDQNQPLLLQGGTQAFRRRQRIRRLGEPARCWLGVPLQVEAKAIGAIVVQSYTNDHAYSEDDRRLLGAVANQVAGAIQTVQLKEEADRNARRLAVLQQAVGELMRLAEQSEEWLWHAALTVTTAGYALGFNRAMLFLLSPNRRLLQGRMGIGQLDGRQANRDWRRDDLRSLTFDGYLAELRAERILPTPVDEIVREMVFRTNEGTALDQALNTRRRVLVPPHNIDQLPQGFVRTFGVTEYAVLPIVLGEKSLGVLLVDNYFTFASITAIQLDQLETLLTQVAQVSENRRQRHASDQLIEVNQAVLVDVANRPLKEVLDQICEAAQVITGADCVVIHPLLARSAPDIAEIDREHSGYVGLLNSFITARRPAEGGITDHILRTRKAQVVNDIDGAAWPDGQPIARSEFVRREEIRAFIALPIIDAISEILLGVLYLHYRTAQGFTETDLKRATSFAELAGGAIRVNRFNITLRRGRDLARREMQARGRELVILQETLITALQPATDRTTLAHKLLVAAHELLGLTAGQVGLILRQWHTGAGPAGDKHEVRSQYFLLADGSLETRHGQKLYTGITGYAIQQGDDLYVPDVNNAAWSDLFRPRIERMAAQMPPTRSELDVLIHIPGQPILGLFNVESPQIDAFQPRHKEMLQRLAAIAALTLNNLNRQEHLREVLNAAESVVSATDVITTLRAVVDAVRKIAPEIDAVTTWYRDDLTSTLINPGPHYGIRDAASLQSSCPIEGTALDLVLRWGRPIWATSTHDEAQLIGRFVHVEEICSTAAFPLIVSDVSDEIRSIGAIFFNYRQPHQFTDEERALFPILAAIAAASVRDAIRLEKLRQERARLQAALDITDAVGSSESLDATLKAILQALVRQFPSARPAVLTYHQRRRELEFAQVSLEFYAIGHGERSLHLSIDRDRSIACAVAQVALERGEPICWNIGDVHQEPAYLEVNPSTRSELCLALLNTERRLQGVLVLESDRLHAFSQEDVSLVRGIGPAISVAIERAYRGAELRFQSSVAGLTAWAAEIAHDINREVGSIKQHAYMLNQTMIPEISDHINAIVASARRLAQFGKTPRSTELEAFAIDPWLRARLHDMIDRYNVAIAFELNAPAAVVLASRLLLERVLRHLVRNAVEAMHGRGGTITVHTYERQDQVEVQLINDGPPIPEAIRQRLFIEPTSTKDEGPLYPTRGLGLLFVRWAVEVMGGQIELLPGTGGEVIFAFTLRRNQREHEGDDEQTLLTARAGG